MIIGELNSLFKQHLLSIIPVEIGNIACTVFIITSNKSYRSPNIGEKNIFTSGYAILICDVIDSFAPEMLFYSIHTAHKSKISMKNIENIINRLFLLN
jgi:hypothetical protein